MALAIYTQIMDALETAADAMATPTFRHNYDNINQHLFKSKTYPSLMIDFLEEEAQDPDNDVVDAYTGFVDVVFMATVDDAVSDVNQYLDEVLEDIKRLMEDEHNTLHGVGMLVADYRESERNYRLVKKRPGQIKIIFNIHYRVKRTNPAITT